MSEYTIRDSGERREFSTGAVRDRGSGKARPDLIPAIAMLRLGVHYSKGAFKYNDRNWEKGMPISEYYASYRRHILQWELGFDDEDHLSAALFNLLGVMHHEEMVVLGLLPKELDDMPHPMLGLEPSEVEEFTESLSFTPPEKVS